MKISEKWLREWVSPKLDTRALAERLTMAGLEVVAIESVAPILDRVVVGEIVSVAPHPSADKLQLCRVNVGKGKTLDIVCGAANAAPDMRAPVALEGATLPGGMKIKQAEVRGVISAGMLCSASELGLAESADGLLSLNKDARPGTSIADYLGLDDVTLEIDLTPNRGDCLSIARIIGDINPSAITPIWMKEKLRRGGIRSIHPVVDVTNYVMLELGQPMHAFDLEKLHGAIHVRHAAKNESLVLLDGNRIKLEPGPLLIADDRQPLALAGIMGGLDSAVSG